MAKGKVFKSLVDAAENGSFADELVLLKLKLAQKLDDPATPVYVVPRLTTELLRAGKALEDERDRERNREAARLKIVPPAGEQKFDPESV